ncbi:MAG: hypothetical protein ACXABY_13100 [Candidatus Thorarchaeota archaeon]|jgi:hypothetical protein
MGYNSEHDEGLRNSQIRSAEERQRAGEECKCGGIVIFRDEGLCINCRREGSEHEPV